MSKHRFLSMSVLCIFLYMLRFPKEVFSGASQGLLLWFQVVLPTLLPYMIIINLLLLTPAIHWICRFSAPILSPLLGTSYYGTFAVLTGFLCGYPMGAKTTSDLLDARKITRSEASYLLAFCNNTSPAFILSYVLLQNLKSPDLSLPFLSLLTLSPVITSFLYRFIYILRHNDSCNFRKITPATDSVRPLPNTAAPFESSSEFFDLCIMNAFESITKIGGYMILFSVIITLLTSLLPDHIFTLILCSSLEISTGIRLIAASTLPFWKQLLLCASLTSFGGWCCIAQTQSMIAGNRLPILPYIAEKLATASVTSLLISAYIYVYSIVN